MAGKTTTDKTKALQSLLDSCAVGIARIENQTLSWVNMPFLDIFGYDTREEVEDKNVAIFFQTGQDLEFAWQTMCRELAEKGRADYELDMVKKDGTLFPVHVSLRPADPQMPQTGITATITDISLARSVQKKTMEKERLQGVVEMAGAICHEINQPLQAIIGYTELLVMDPESSTSGSCLENIKSQTDRLGKITAKLANINWYKTIDYPGNQKIVDIWRTDPEDNK